MDLSYFPTGLQENILCKTLDLLKESNQCDLKLYDELLMRHPMFRRIYFHDIPNQYENETDGFMVYFKHSFYIKP